MELIQYTLVAVVSPQHVLGMAKTTGREKTSPLLKVIESKTLHANLSDYISLERVLHALRRSHTLKPLESLYVQLFGGQKALCCSDLSVFPVVSESLAQHVQRPKM